MDAHDWDRRYAAHDLVWSSEPNRFVAEIVGALAPGSAIDVAAGEGRNAIWLVEQGWTVTATDYSRVAVERMTVLAAERLGEQASRLTAVVADVTVPTPRSSVYDLALFCYLQLPAPMMGEALAAGVAAVRPGGHVVVICHAGQNLLGGYGGPGDRAVLHDPDEVQDAVSGQPVAVVLSGIRKRPVDTPDGPREALDTVVVLRHT